VFKDGGTGMMHEKSKAKRILGALSHRRAFTALACVLSSFHAIFFLEKNTYLDGIELRTDRIGKPRRPDKKKYLQAY